MQHKKTLLSTYLVYQRQSSLHWTSLVTQNSPQVVVPTKSSLKGHIPHANIEEIHAGYQHLVYLQNFLCWCQKKKKKLTILKYSLSHERIIYTVHVLYTVLHFCEVYVMHQLTRWRPLTFEIQGTSSLSRMQIKLCTRLINNKYRAYRLGCTPD